MQKAQNIFTATSDATMRNNIRASWVRASTDCREQGRDWYPSTNRLVMDFAVYSALPTEVVAGIVAVLSPRSAWGTNVRNTAAVLVKAGHLDEIVASAILRRHGYDGDPERLLDGPRGLGKSVDKAMAIASLVAHGFGTVDEYVTGQKVRSFYSNILDPAHSDDVTIDAWAAAVAIGRRLSTREMGALSAKEYARIVDQYRLVAAELDMIPSELQAVTWCEVRGRVR